MSTKKRIGNDLNITWSVLKKDRTAYPINSEILDVYMVVNHCRVNISSISVSGNRISFTYYGKDQKRTGSYALVLIENKGQSNMITHDVKDAFVLVPHSWQEEYDSEPENVFVESVLNNDIIVPDEETITSDQYTGVIGLKNRTYDESEPNGLGYKILSKDVPFAEQVLETNTTYEVRYDFDLGGESVTLPQNSVLKFVGGKLLNGVVVGDYTEIVSESLGHIFDNVRLDGTYQNKVTHFSWFKHSDTNNTSEFRSLFRLSSGVVFTDVYIDGGPYYIDGYYEGADVSAATPFVANLPDNSYIHNSSIINILPTTNQQSFPLYVRGRENITLDGGAIVGPIDLVQTLPGEHGHGLYIRGGKNITIKNISISKCCGDGIDIQYDANNYIHNENILVDNVVCDSNARQGISIEDGISVSVRNCRLENTGTILGKNPKSGIDVEPSYSEAVIDGVVISDCLLLNNSGPSLMMNATLGVWSNVLAEGIIGDGSLHIEGGIATLCPEINIKNSSFTYLRADKVNKVAVDGCTLSGVYNASGKINSLRISNCQLKITEKIADSAGIYIVGTHDSEDIEFSNCFIDAKTAVMSSTMCLSFIGCTIRYTSSNGNALMSMTGSFRNCIIEAEKYIRWFAIEDSEMIGCKIVLHNTGATYSSEASVMLMSAKKYTVEGSDIIEDVIVPTGTFTNYYALSSAATLVLNGGDYTSFNRNLDSKSLVSVTYNKGLQIFSSNRPLWWNGTAWVDSTGTAV